MAEPLLLAVDETQVSPQEVSTWLKILRSQTLTNVLTALAYFIVGYLLIKYLIHFVRKLLCKKGKLDASIQNALLSVIRGALLLILLLSCADRLGLPTTSLLTLVGTLGLAFSLALQNSLSNLAGGIFILTSKPFVTGDYISVGGDEGTVTKVGFIHTQLSAVDNRQVFVPNSTITGSSVVNYSHEDRRRIDLSIPVPYDCSLARAKEAIAQAVGQDERLLEEPFIRTWELASSSVTIKVRVWCKSQDYWELRCALLERIKLALDDAGIAVPFDQLDVHIIQPKQ